MKFAQELLSYKHLSSFTHLVVSPPKAGGECVHCHSLLVQEEETKEEPLQLYGDHSYLGRE